jgi:hypothetical protein
VRSASVHLAEQCKSEPCLRVDTVFSEAVPKDFFPHCKGGTQIFSRCFCMNDSGTKRIYDRNEYYRYDYYRYKKYVGKKLYGECFGYNKTGQKSIQI